MEYMDNNLDIGFGKSPDRSDPKLVQWLKILLLVRAGSLVLGLLANIPGVPLAATLVPWAQRLMTLAVVLSLFGMTGYGERYRKAAIFYAISLVDVVVTSLGVGGLVGLAVSICAIIASYQELNAHSELVAPMDQDLSRKWHSLFYWELVVGITSSFVTIAGVVASVMGGMEEGLIVRIFVAILTVVNAVMGLIYILFMKKTQDLFQ